MALKRFSIAWSPQLWGMIESYCSEHSISPTTLIRDAVINYLTNQSSGSILNVSKANNGANQNDLHYRDG